MVANDLIKNKMFVLGTTLDEVSAQSNVSVSSLSAFLRGTRDLPRDKFLQVDEALNDMLDLAKFHEPIPIDWKNSAVIRSLIDSMKRKKRIQANDAAAEASNPFRLLAELANNDFDSICMKHNWSRVELAQQLADASSRLDQMRADIAHE